MKKKIDEIRMKIDSFIADFTITKFFMILTVFLLIVLFVILFIFMCKLVIRFIVANYELLLLCGSIVVAVVYIIWCKRVNNEPTQAVKMRYQTKIEEEQEKQEREAAYLHIQKLLFFVINDTAILTKIPPLKSVSALDAPIHSVLVNNSFYVFQYLVAKDTATALDLITIKQRLNERIDTALRTGEIMGSHEAFFSNSGKRYPRILIHDIRNNGTYIQIDAVIVGHPYADYIERPKAVRNTTVDNSDLDF
ncbi:MAG: hypothetical protein E7396_09865 [Ruminococcaceae bacterium]|nr:hypothetical protein [Oscillospiraceae bacterium]